MSSSDTPASWTASITFCARSAMRLMTSAADPARPDTPSTRFATSGVPCTSPLAVTAMVRARGAAPAGSPPTPIRATRAAAVTRAMWHRRFDIADPPRSTACFDGETAGLVPRKQPRASFHLETLDNADSQGETLPELQTWVPGLAGRILRFATIPRDVKCCVYAADVRS